MNYIRTKETQDPLLIEVYLKDELLRVLPKRLFNSLLRELPQNTQEEDFRKIFFEKEERLAKIEALKLLSKRSLFKNELKEKLKAKGFSLAAQESAVSYSQKLGVLSEQKKVQYLIEKALEKGKGERYIRASLRKYRLDEQLINECFQQLQIDPRSAIQQLLPKLKKKYTLSDPNEKKKAVLFLQRRGFHLEDIFAALQIR